MYESTFDPINQNAC